MTHQKILFFPTAIFLLFYDVGVALDIALEKYFFELYSEDKLHPVSQ